MRRAIAMAAFFVIALVGSILASFVGFMEWFWPGTTVLLVVLCITLLLMLLMQRDRWLLVGIVTIVLFVILDLTGITNWFIFPEQGQSQTTTVADCLNTEQKAFVISTSDPLITTDIKAKAATMKDDDSLCATARAIVTHMAAPAAQEVPAGTAEPTEPTPTSVAGAFTFETADAANSCSVDDIVRYNDGNEPDAKKTYEVGGGGLELWRYQPNKSTPAVWILVPVMEPVKITGFAEAWEGNSAEACANFDWRKFAQDHQRPGDSTVFIDARSNPVVVDAGDMSPADAQAIADAFVAAMEKGT